MRRNSSGGVWCAGSLSGARVCAGPRRGKDQRGGDGAPGSAGLLLARDGALGALAGTGVGLGALTAHRQAAAMTQRSEEHTSELQSRGHLVCRLLLEKKNRKEK